MSYRNPQVYFADTQAFSKGFEESFGKFQQKFEDERLEKERVAKEQDESFAEALKASDLSGIVGLDTRIMDGLQNSIDSIIKEGGFATASASEQAKMLRKVSAVKSAVSRLGELAQIDNKDWDMRNSTKLGSLKAALTRGDKSIRIEGKGLDLKIIGDFGEVSLDELSASKFMKRSDYEGEYKDLNSSFITKADSIFKEAAKLGLGIEEIEKSLEQQYYFLLRNNGDAELFSYLLSNEVSAEGQKEAGSMYYNDPDIAKTFTPEENNAFVEKQIKAMSSDLAKKAIGSVYNYSEFAAAYKLKAEQERSMEWAKINAANNSGTNAPPRLTNQQAEAYQLGRSAIRGREELNKTPVLRDNWSEMRSAAETGNVAAITGTPLARIMISAGYSLEGDVPNGYRFTKKGAESIELRTDYSEQNIRAQLESAFDAQEKINQDKLIRSGVSIYKTYDTEGNEVNPQSTTSGDNFLDDIK